MDEPWAIERMETWVSMTTLGEAPPMPDGIFVGGDRRSLLYTDDELLTLAQVVEKILDRVLPKWRDEVRVDKSRWWQQHRTAAIRAIADLRTREEVAARLGDDAPTLSAAALHPWVWEAARSLWQSQHYREAVHASAVKLNAETQNKLGRRDVAETELFKSALTNDKATPTHPRLKLEESETIGDKTTLSRRRGVMALAEGAYAALRNPISHVEGELSEQEALEQLAVFSVIARAVDAATVVRSS